MNDTFLKEEERVSLDFLLKLYTDGKIPFAVDSDITSIVPHLHRVLFPSELMDYVKTRRVANFPTELMVRLNDSGIELKFRVVDNVTIGATYIDKSGTTVTYKVPLVFKYQ